MYVSCQQKSWMQNYMCIRAYTHLCGYIRACLHIHALMLSDVAGHVCNKLGILEQPVQSWHVCAQLQLFLPTSFGLSTRTGTVISKCYLSVSSSRIHGRLIHNSWNKAAHMSFADDICSTTWYMHSTMNVYATVLSLWSFYTVHSSAPSIPSAPLGMIQQSALVMFRGPTYRLLLRHPYPRKHILASQIAFHKSQWGSLSLSLSLSDTHTHTHTHTHLYWLLFFLTLMYSMTPQILWTFPSVVTVHKRLYTYLSCLCCSESLSKADSCLALGPSTNEWCAHGDLPRNITLDSTTPLSFRLQTFSCLFRMQTIYCSHIPNNILPHAQMPMTTHPERDALVLEGIWSKSRSVLRSCAETCTHIFNSEEHRIVFWFMNTSNDHST